MMSKIHIFNQMGNEVNSLARRRFLIRGALVPLIPMATILPGAMSMNAAASSGVTSLFILKNGTRFNGLGQDPLLAMQHLGNGYRMYNPTLMRFQAMDNLAPFNEGGVHSYAYVSNDPINQIDPTGHMGVMAIIGLVGLAVVAVGVTLMITSNVVANNHKEYAQSILPEDWTWEYDWSEYDSSMQAAKDWETASKVGMGIAAVGGVMLMVGGSALTKSGVKSAKKGIGKITSKFKKAPKPTQRATPLAGQVRTSGPVRTSGSARSQINRKTRTQSLGSNSHVPSSPLSPPEYSSLSLPARL